VERFGQPQFTDWTRSPVYQYTVAVSFPRSVRRAPLILSLCIVIVTGLGASFFFPRILNVTVNHVLQRTVDSSFRAELRGVSDVSLQGIAVETILLEAANESIPFQHLRVSEVRIAFDVLSVFRGDGLAGLEGLEIGEIAVFLQEATLQSIPGGDDTASDSTPISSEQIARVERRVAQALMAVPAGIDGPIAVSLYEVSTGDGEASSSGTNPSATTSFPGNPAVATGEVTVTPGSVRAKLTHAGYTVSLTVETEEGIVLAAEGWAGGPGMAAAARVDYRGAVFSAELSPQDLQFPPPFSLPDAVRGFGSASASFRLETDSRTDPSPAPPSPAAPSRDGAGATSAIVALQEGIRALSSLNEKTPEGTDIPSTLPSMHATLTIRDADPGRIIPAFDGRPPLPLFSATVRTIENAIKGTATLDGGSFGTVSARGISLPLDQPRAVSVGTLAVDLPAGLVIPSESLPPQLLSAAGTLGLTGTGEAVVSLPAVSLSATAERGVVAVSTRADHANHFNVSAEGRVNLVQETVAFTSVETRYSDGPRTLTAKASLRATWDELWSLEMFAPIPVGFDMRAQAQLTVDETAVTADVRLASGRVRIDSLIANHNGASYALAGAGAGAGAEETPDAPYIEATAGMYRLSPSRIRLAPGLVTVSGTATPAGLAGSVNLQDVPITRILAVLAPVSEATPADDGSPGRAADSPVQRVSTNRAITGGNLSGQVEFNTEFQRPYLAAAIRGEAMNVLGETGSFAVEIEQDTTSLEIKRGEVDLANLLTGSFSGRLPIAVTRSGITLLNLTDSALTASLRSARFDTFFPRDEDELRPEGALTVQMELLEQTGDLQTEIDFRVRPETVEDGSTVSGFGYERLTGTLRATEDRLDRVTVSFSAAADGVRILEATADARVPGLSKAKPTRNIDEISWWLEGTSELPLEYIAPFLPGVVALTGTISGQIAGSGTVATPTLSGRIAVEDGELRTAGPTPAVSAINGAIRFQEARFFTENFSAESGLSPFSVSIDGTLPVDGEPGELTASLTGQNVLVTTSPFVRVRADAELRLVGSLSGDLSLEGLVTIRDGLYSQDIPLIDFDTVPSIDPDMFQLFSVQNRFAARTDLDVRIVADETFRIENNLYKGVFSSDLTLGGTLEVPRPRGRVFTDSGRLTLPLTSLRVEQAVLRFPRDRPFTPDLQARAATRLRDYQLSVTVTGTLPGVEVNVTSTPPLSQGDALVLLSTGFTPQELASSGNRAALAIGSRLGTQFVQSLVGTTGGDTGEELADRVSVLLGEGVSESGAETIEVEFRLTEEDSWFLVFRRDRYERYNMDLAWRFWLD
jgi:hypothetical protein